MGNFAKRTPPQKPIVMNCAITTKEFKKRDGSMGTCGIFSFKDGNKSYIIQIQKAESGKETKKGKPITGWAQVAQFIDGGAVNGGW